MVLRGAVRTPVELAAAVSLRRLAAGLDLLAERGDDPVAGALLAKIESSSVGEERAAGGGSLGPNESSV